MIASAIASAFSSNEVAGGERRSAAYTTCFMNSAAASR